MHNTFPKVFCGFFLYSSATELCELDLKIVIVHHTYSLILIFLYFSWFWYLYCYYILKQMIHTIQS